MIKKILLASVLASSVFGGVTDGAFGLKLGDKVSKSIATKANRTSWCESEGYTSYKIKHNQIGKLTEFEVTVADHNNVIQSISANSDNFRYMSSCKDALKPLRNGLIQKYGKPNNNNLTYLSKDKNRKLNVFCTEDRIYHSSGASKIIGYKILYNLDDTNLQQKTRDYIKNKKSQENKSFANTYSNQL